MDLPITCSPEISKDFQLIGFRLTKTEEQMTDPLMLEDHDKKLISCYKDEINDITKLSQHHFLESNGIQSLTLVLSLWRYS